jgi:CHASE2 domain-containing sensor protein
MPIKLRKIMKPALGAVLTVLCGLILWRAAFGEVWIRASYDYLFRFGSHTVTNDVVLVMMDNDSFDNLHQTRNGTWDRALHARLLNRLADDGCSLVVLDAFFRTTKDPDEDEALIGAMRRNLTLVLMANRAETTHPELMADYAVLPAHPFLDAAQGRWGVAWLEPDLDLIVREHWPDPSPGHYPSLPEAAARVAGARLDDIPQEKWLRYYGRNGAWTRLGYRFALNQKPGFFRGKTVFIGTEPATPLPSQEPDEFSTPYTRWTGESSGGAEILATEFLNLMNNDWLRRPAPEFEGAVLALCGAALGLVLWFPTGRVRIVVAVAVALIAGLGAILATHYSNYWFPWMLVVGGQLPVALAYAYAVPRRKRIPAGVVATASEGASHTAVDLPPEIADYTPFHPPFGRGAYGRVWLAKNAVGQWQALKVVYASNFSEAGPYEREFNGVSRYKPVSDKNPNLLRVDFVGTKRPDYFYYVMELGDSLVPDWQSNPSTYKPRDLISERKNAPGGKLPVRDCVRMGLTLADGLDFLHRQGLTHRDIKPQNVIFVNGQPKLADIGLIAEIRPPEEEHTYVGTIGYMPPPPERPGTAQADIYALGMMLYVLGTGKQPVSFPELSTTLAEGTGFMEFIPLNSVILTACQPDPAQRYATAADFHRALQDVLKTLDSSGADQNKP